MNNIKKDIRIRFKKTGPMRFISHLDLNRTMARAFRRAGLPIAYSEGFNPRPKLVFGLNLSIGAESECEVLDTQITEEMEYEDIMKALNDTLPAGLEVYYVKRPVMPLKTIGTCDYEITIPCPSDISERANEVFTPPVMILKQTKSSEAVTDISENIKHINASYADGILTINARLTSGNNDYLNPEYVVKVIAEKVDINVLSADYRIMRKEIYNTDNSVFR